MLESAFQAKLIKELKRKFPGAVLLKNDPNYLQGIPDWIMLGDNKWAALEIKASQNSSLRPNQEYYINLLNEMSFARLIFPENKEEIIDELQQAFRTRRSSRFFGG